MKMLPPPIEFMRMRSEQRAARFLARRVDRQDGDSQAVRLVEAEAPHQLVGERALARAAGAGDAEHRRGVGLGGLLHCGLVFEGAQF
jgi:hypothetical protein